MVVSVEEICLERYFLGPGSLGPIGSVYVSDEDLLEIFGVLDAAEAQCAFVTALPHMPLLRAYLSGDIMPIRGRKPEYVRILVFLCWMQTTRTRQRGDRDFREMLEKQTGEKFRGASMRGLNPMWEHLREYLAKQHEIQLDLPGINPHAQIGRTLRIAFPTWRDRAVFRKLRHAIDPDHLLDPQIVSNRVSTSRHLLTEKMPSFEYNFDLFDRARKRGGRDYTETPFWHAWYAIVAEQAALEDLEIMEGEFGDYELFRASPLGERQQVRAPEEVIKYVPKAISKAIGKGVVLLENMGFGRYRATNAFESHVMLIHTSKLAECEEGTIDSYGAINLRWSMVSFRSQVTSAPIAAETGPRVFGWHDGIRVGSALLGRSPFSPHLTTPDQSMTTVKVNSTDIDMIRDDSGLAFPPGVYFGSAVGCLRNENREVLLVARANEVADTRRLAFDEAREISEDEFNRETAPSANCAIESWSGARMPVCDEMVTVGEALYARTARGLSFAEAFEMVRKGLSFSSSHPSEWDVLRSFADAGWFDFTLLRSFPARRILQRPLTWEMVTADAVRISGPTPLSVIDRITVAAQAEGATLEVWGGVSKWSLPRYLVRAKDPSRLRAFVENAGIAAAAARSQGERPHGAPGGVHGYHVAARLNEERGFFDAQEGGDMVEGLYRLERTDTRNPFLYRSVVAGQPGQNFVSPTLAILSHHARRRKHIFAYDGSTLAGILPRVSLPSSWARWASDCSMCNAGSGLVYGQWRYLYPMEEPTVSALSKVVSIAQRGVEVAPWVGRFLASASNRNRTIFDSRSGKIRIAAGERS
ncbi:hypothetical protein NP945_26860 [Mesorhizobium sp. LMG17149]|uniref:hypothetical protein n=1 Tax=Mesorhizobium sp. LMG17149 TaxID=2968497 RepID=UPI00211874D2|nr:hypothetical protein [Mesorhizobium sp. LMG17149]MCQ8875462.1 hypothetical protein [Mesorhizobium sp. LMG17149]